MMRTMTTTTPSSMSVPTAGRVLSRRVGGGRSTPGVVAAVQSDDVRWHPPMKMKLTRRFNKDGVKLTTTTTTTRATEEDDAAVVAAVDDDIAIADAMAAARACEEIGLSPGAGLKDADAQAEAAFADMINTTVDVTGEALSSDDLSQLAEGGRMDRESTSQKSGGVLDDIKDLFGALSKGAHIVKQKGGRV